MEKNNKYVQEALDNHQNNDNTSRHKEIKLIREWNKNLAQKYLLLKRKTEPEILTERNKAIREIGIILEAPTQDNFDNMFENMVEELDRVLKIVQ